MVVNENYEKNTHILFKMSLVEYLGETDPREWLSLIILLPFIILCEIIPPHSRDFFEGDIQFSYPLMKETFSYKQFIYLIECLISYSS